MNKVHEERKAAGVCIYCGERPAKDGKFGCEQCLERQREIRRKHAAKCKAEGVCIDCGSKVEEWSTSPRCYHCRDVAKEKAVAKAGARLRDGLCVRCGKHPVEEGKAYCAICLQKTKDYYQRRKEEFILGGVCTKCGRPVEAKGHKRCNRCRGMAYFSMLRSYKEARTHAGFEG